MTKRKLGYVDTKWKAALEGNPYDIEHRVMADGEVRWVREKAELEFDTQNICIRALGFTQAITGRKNAEAESRRQAEILNNMSDRQDGSRPRSAAGCNYEKRGA